MINKTEESDGAQEDVTITFDLYRMVTDSAAMPQAITDGGQIWFRGDSSDYVTTGWEADLPAGYEG